MGKQVVKKGVGIHRKGLNAWKEQANMVVEKPKEGEIVEVSNMSNADKPQTWLDVGDAFRDATKLPGLPLGNVISIIGHSNAGKTTLMNHALVAAQKQGLIPVIIDTENAFSFQYAISMGFEATPIYGMREVEDVDPETGEILGTHPERCILNWEGNFLYFNNKILAERYGNKDYSSGTITSSKRKEAVLEDVASCVIELLDAQDNGELEAGLVFCWDSVGSIGSFKEWKAKGGGNAMWMAASLSQAFGTLLNARIPGSKKISSPYTNTFIYINKVWMDATTNPVGPAIMRTKGGGSFKYATRLEILMGGQLTAGVKRLTASSKGLTYGYGTQTKIKVLKNHLNAPHNVCYEDAIVATDGGFIKVEDIDTYKKEHISAILKRLNDLSEGKTVINESDIQFQEVEEDE